MAPQSLDPLQSLSIGRRPFQYRAAAAWIEGGLSNAVLIS